VDVVWLCSAAETHTQKRCPVTDLPSVNSDVRFPSETHPLSALPDIKPSVPISTMYSSLNRKDIEFYFDFVFDLNGSTRDAYGIYADVALFERCRTAR
jgi:hypothetical protein